LRNLLFISHVQPDDNERAVWLYSRLRLLGYNPWCDLKGLKGGERDYWDDIQQRIETNSCKFLLIVTERTFKKDGVLDEFEFAKSVATQHPELRDFILMLKFDDSPYNTRIGQNRYNHINFNTSWSTGFKNLVEKLETDKVDKSQEVQSDAAQLWHSDIGIDRHQITPSRCERYYSNWWPIGGTPETLFIYQYANEPQANAIFDECVKYPVQKMGSLLSSFDQDILTVSSKNNNAEIKPQIMHKIKVKDILNGFEAKEFPTHKDAETQLKRLLNRCLHLMMKRRGVHWHELAGKSNCYYFPTGVIEKDKCTVNYHNRKKSKKLIGRFRSYYWHFGVSFRTRLRPVLCFSLQSHIVFSDDGREVWKEKTALHSARRTKGRRMFNEQWRDQLFAYLQALTQGHQVLNIDLNKDFTLEMHPFTATYFSAFGYSEPTSKERQDALIDDYVEFEFYQNVDSADKDEE